MRIENIEGGVLVGLHYLAFAGTLVVDAAKMQDAVDDDAHQFAAVWHSELLSVGGYGIEGDHNVAGDAGCPGIVESDDVGVVVMGDEFAVGLEDILVVHEKVVDVAGGEAMQFGHPANPFPGFVKIDVGHFYALRFKVYHF